MHIRQIMSLSLIFCVAVTAGCSSSSTPEKTSTPETTATPWAPEADMAQTFRNYFEADDEARYKPVHIDYMVDCYIDGLEEKVSSESSEKIRLLDRPAKKGGLYNFANLLEDKDQDLFYKVSNHCFISPNDFRNKPIAETDVDKAIDSAENYAAEYSLIFEGMNPEVLSTLDIKNYYPQLNHTTKPLTNDSELRSAATLVAETDRAVMQTRDNETGICYFAEVTIERTFSNGGTDYRFYASKGEASVGKDEACPLEPDPSTPYAGRNSGRYGWELLE